MSEEAVLTFEGWRYYRLWWQTLKLARRTGDSPMNWRQNLGVRLRSLQGAKRPVFILGCPRSGTTFLGNVLGKLSRVSYYFEPPAMKYYTRLIHEGVVTRSQARRFYSWGCRALMLAAPGHGARFMEKNPKHTWVAETLHDVFPDVQFVVITRDGRDVSLSLSEKPWHRREWLPQGKREPGGYLYGPYPHFYIEAERAAEYAETSDIHRCIWIWRRYAEEVERLKTVLPAEIQYHLTYEELVQQPVQTLHRVLSFLDKHDANSRETVMAAAATGHSSSVGRWRESLTTEQLVVIDREAGDMLCKLGYET